MASSAAQAHRRRTQVAERSDSECGTEGAGGVDSAAERTARAWAGKARSTEAKQLKRLAELKKA